MRARKTMCEGQQRMSTSKPRSTGSKRPAGTAGTTWKINYTQPMTKSAQPPENNDTKRRTPTRTTTRTTHGTPPSPSEQRVSAHTTPPQEHCWRKDMKTTQIKNAVNTLDKTAYDMEKPKGQDQESGHAEAEGKDNNHHKPDKKAKGNKEDRRN